MIKIFIFEEKSFLKNREAAARSFSLDFNAGALFAVRSGMWSTSRPLGVITSGYLPRKFFASEAVISLTVVKQSASLAEATSMEYLALILWALASASGDILSMTVYISTPEPARVLPRIVACVVNMVPISGTFFFTHRRPAPHIHS